MTTTDAVKKSGTHISLARESVFAAQRLIQKGERVLHAVVGNCTVSNHSKACGTLVVTSHRIIFCTKSWHSQMLLGDCIGLGDITGKLINKMTITSAGSSITVELSRDYLTALQTAILDAVASYPNQQPIDFSASEYASAEPIVEKKVSAVQTAAPRPAIPRTKHGQAKQRIKENKAAGVACCPKCGSTSLSANKKGFGVGKAVAGMFLTGGLAGAVAGGIGANKIEVTCLNCGHKFRP